MLPSAPPTLTFLSGGTGRASVRGRQAVERGRVRPEHARPRRVVEGRDRPLELVDRAGEGGVVMRVVGSPDHPLLAEEREEGGQGVLVDLEADPALAGEVLARGEGHVGAEVTEALGLLIEPLQPERTPA